MTYLYEIVVGIIIGGAMILPGVSGGVLAVILGIYDDIMYALNNIFKQFKKSMRTLIPLGIGGMIGVLLFSKAIKFLFENYSIATQYAFMGFVVGGVPALMNDVKKKGGTINYVAILISFLIVVGLLILDQNDVLGGGFTAITDVSYLRIIISGILLAIGVILPGVSNFQLLMLIGMYHVILNIAAGIPEVLFDINTMLRLIPLGISFILSVIAMIKLYNYLAKKNYSLLYSVIIGFVIGALPVMYPGFAFNLETFIGIILAGFGFYISYYFGKKENN